MLYSYSYSSNFSLHSSVPKVRWQLTKSPGIIGLCTWADSKFSGRVQKVGILVLF